MKVSIFLYKGLVLSKLTKTLILGLFLPIFLFIDAKKTLQFMGH